DYNTSLETCVRYDPQTGGWLPAPPMIEKRGHATATLLSSGKVLVAGGEDGGLPSITTELRDAIAGTSAMAGTLREPKESHVAALLPGDQVLVAGGRALSYTQEGADLYDAATGFWTPLAPVPEAREGATANTLPDGKALVAGGECTGFNCQVDGI